MSEAVGPDYPGKTYELHDVSFGNRWAVEQ